MFETFPELLLESVADVRCNLRGRIEDGRQTMGSVPQLADFTGGGFWAMTLEQMLLESDEHILEYRGFRQRYDSGVHPFIALRPETKQPWPVVAGETVYDIFTQTLLDAPLRATSLLISHDPLLMGTLRRGHVFSINHVVQSGRWRVGPRMYEIESVETPVSGQRLIRFTPPLRELTPLGTFVDFMTPRFVGRVVPGTMAHSLRSTVNGPFAPTILEAAPPWPINSAMFAEMVRNGTLDVPLMWNIGTRWSIADGVATVVPGAEVSDLSQAMSPTPGLTYRVQFQITRWVAGSVTPRFSGGTAVIGTPVANTVGIHTRFLTAVTGNNLFLFRPNDIADLDIDNISVTLAP